MKSTDQRDSILRSASANSTIQQHSVDADRMKNLDTHHCITIKWSPHSACRVGLTAARAALGGAAVLPCGGVLDAVQAPAAGVVRRRGGIARGTGGGRS
jgi:hypothetical protein